MPKFSIIVPFYNTGLYLKKCLDSIFNQDYCDFEVILVNDGSSDDSYEIVDTYLKKYNNIKYLYQENSGLSIARNNGVLKASGEYLLFLDSDDYYQPGLLKRLSLEVDGCDVVRFQVQDAYSDGHVVKYCDNVFSKMNGKKAFSNLVMNHYVEIACIYCFKRSFWLKNKFTFKAGAYHEDFGLIPLVLIKSKFIKSIDFYGYNYFKRDVSITNGCDYEKSKKMALDFLEHFKFLKKESLNIKGDLSVFNSYIANSVIIKSTILKGVDYKKYYKEIKNIGAFDMLLEDSLGRKIKKFFIKISPKLYYKIVRR